MSLKTDLEKFTPIDVKQEIFSHFDDVKYFLHDLKDDVSFAAQKRCLSKEYAKLISSHIDVLFLLLNHGFYDSKEGGLK